MLFVYDAPTRPLFHMRGMAFDLDLVWIRAGRVVGITPDARAAANGDAPGYLAPEPVDSVLEVPAGTARAHEWAVGTKVEAIAEGA